MKIKPFYFNELRECCYVVWDETNECVIIDPGSSSSDEFSRLSRFIEEKGLKPTAILLTHGHFDHILGLADTSSLWNVKTFYNFEDSAQIQDAAHYCSYFELNYKPFTGESSNISDGDIISFGNSCLEVLATPGHSQGSVCYYCRKENVIFTGDTLFAGSIGRTDLPGGDYEQLERSINEKLMILDGDVAIYPGHGLSSDIGYERTTNPFIRLQSR